MRAQIVRQGVGDRLRGEQAHRSTRINGRQLTRVSEKHELCACGAYVLHELGALFGAHHAELVHDQNVAGAQKRAPAIPRP